MKFFFFSLLIALLSCQKTDLDSPERIEAAYISDPNVIADGCEAYVRLAITVSNSSGTSGWYKPTSATLPIYQQALKDIPASPNTTERAVIVRFTETGQQVELQCGWGSRPKVGEIKILAITKR